MSDFNKRFNAAAKASGGKSIFDFSKLGDVKFWKQKEGVNKINILPYVVSSKNHPLVHSGDLNKGDNDYNLEIFVHTYIGPSNATVICPKKTYGTPCPICEQSQEYKDAGKTKESEALWAKKKMYYSIQDVLKPGDGVQLFETNFKYFEKPLRSLARDTDDGTAFINFPDLKKGKIVKFMGEKEKFEGKDFVQFANFKFLERDESIAALADDAIAFDKYLVVHTYEELEALLHGAAISDDDDDDDEPAPRVSRQVKDEDDAPPAKKPPVEEKEESRCPAPGGVFGKDNDNHKECAKCSEYRACLKESLKD
jgi:hypothetical protein